MQLELLSGLKGEVRNIRGSEAIELAELAHTANAGTNSIGKILKGCWQTTIDPGPYVHAKAGDMGVDWDRVLKGDLIYGLIRLRVSSIEAGARYAFPVLCERCGNMYDWDIADLLALPTRKLPEESVKKVSACEAFHATCTTDDGKTHELTYDLQLPKQNETLRTMLKQLNRKKTTIVETLAVQTRTIDGEVKQPMFRQKFFANNFSLGELNRLRDEYEASDCGVDSDILTTHDIPTCGWRQETALPFGRTFWRPDPLKKTKEKTPEELEAEEAEAVKDAE